MRGLLLTLSLLLSITVSAQSLVNSSSTVINDNADRYELISVDEFGHALVKFERLEDGVLMQDGFYSNGIPVGRWNLYDQNGKIISWMRYDSNGNREQLSSEINETKMTVKYEDDRPSEVKTRSKVQE